MTRSEMLSGTGSDRPDNEDAYGHVVEDPASGLFAIARRWCAFIWSASAGASGTN